MATTPARAIDFLMEVNSLERVDRTGYVMSGVERPEDVAAHSAGVAAASLLIADRVDGPVDRGRLLTMAVLHDVGEARVGDVPLIRKTDEDERREMEAEAEMLDGLPDHYADAIAEYRAQETVESRIVKAADKLQMMAKVLSYEAEGRGDLAAFWENGRNFFDAGLPEAVTLFKEIRLRHDAAGT